MECSAAFSERPLGEPTSVEPTPVADGGCPEIPKCECEELGDLPCWSCYQSERKE